MAFPYLSHRRYPNVLRCGSYGQCVCNGAFIIALSKFQNMNSNENQ